MRINWWLLLFLVRLGPLPLGNTLFPETSLIQGIAKDFPVHLIFNKPEGFTPCFCYCLVVGLYLSSDSFSPEIKRQLIFFVFCDYLGHYKLDFIGTQLGCTYTSTYRRFTFLLLFIRNI